MRFPDRSSGVLLHITSLPSRFGVGDLGPGAHRFADTVASARQRFWQMLPVTPADAGSGFSPYSSPSAFAGAPLFISPELIAEQGLLSKKDLADTPDFPICRADFTAVSSWKTAIFHKAFAQFQKHVKQFAAEFDRFFEENRSWLEDYAFFAALKSHFGGKSWIDWPADLRDRNPKNLEIARGGLREHIEYEIFLQFLFSRQWNSLKSYCNAHDIRLIGDIPIYVNYDSADVWSQPENYLLDSHKRPLRVAGVPPDYFSKTGQRWGNPIYDWNAMKADGFTWWLRRFRRILSMFDLVRIDHFRGLIAYWSIPAAESTAENGEWTEAPANNFMRTVARNFPSLPFIAEDLGTITADVREILTNFDLPGVKVLQFAFGDDVARNAYAPHNIGEHCALYTGTHDNNTTSGWFARETSPEQRARLELYIGNTLDVSSVHRYFLQLALRSPSKLVIIPVQDIFGLGTEARMNTPGVAKGNWTWRMDTTDRSSDWAYLRSLTELFGRA